MSTISSSAIPDLLENALFVRNNLRAVFAKQIKYGSGYMDKNHLISLENLIETLVNHGTFNSEKTMRFALRDTTPSLNTDDLITQLSHYEKLANILEPIAKGEQSLESLSRDDQKVLSAFSSQEVQPIIAEAAQPGHRLTR